ncbi:predicted protein [Nematostella vectensis]|uniref:Major facilitator superfamily (MFS) profile domain-containing protein n=1 Tax=Nematostella vectensis TaxID=45351 RepID=A7T007_NEMVE|nr:predicted protein [Nematostella vectensis]|eukprot:XP_001622815.1 predicted protein [Nematostella vectensis]
MSVSAVVSGALCDKLGSRLTGYLGTVVCSAGLLLSSFAPEIWIVYLTYGLLLGVGTGLIFTSIFSITAKYFNRFRALAVGIVGSGEGLGILVMAPVIQLLLDALQLRNTLRVMAAMVLANTLVMWTFDPHVQEETDHEYFQEGSNDSGSSRELPMPRKRGIEEETDHEYFQEGSNDSGSSRELPMPRKRGIGVCGWIDWSLWKIPTFTVFTLASGLATLAAFIPQFFMVAYCKELGISADRAAWMYVYMGVASLIGHVAIGRLIDRPSIQPGYVYQVCWAIAGVSTLLSRLSTSYAYLSVYFVVFGFAFGAAITCCDVIMLTLVPEARGGTLGMHMMAMALPTATGTPLAVANLIAKHQHYLEIFFLIDVYARVSSTHEWRFMQESHEYSQVEVYARVTSTHEWRFMQESHEYSRVEVYARVTSTHEWRFMQESRVLTSGGLCKSLKSTHKWRFMQESRVLMSGGLCKSLEYSRVEVYARVSSTHEWRFMQESHEYSQVEVYARVSSTHEWRFMQESRVLTSGGLCKSLTSTHEWRFMQESQVLTSGGLCKSHKYSRVEVYARVTSTHEWRFMQESRVLTSGGLCKSLEYSRVEVYARV